MHLHREELHQSTEGGHVVDLPVELSRLVGKGCQVLEVDLERLKLLDLLPDIGS